MHKLLRHSFPSLNSLILSNCGLISQDLCSLAQASVEGRLPSLNSLILSNCGLNSQDLCSLAQASVEGRLPSLNSLILSDCGLNSQDLCSLAQASVEGRLPSLNSLILSNCGLNSQDLRSLAQASVEGRLPSLNSLILSNCGLNSWDLYSLAQASVEGRLPSLNSLILSNCGLNSQDLCSLAQASVEGRLPQPTHQDISKNSDIYFHDLFQAGCFWSHLIKLNITGIKYHQVSEIIHLNSLQEISVYDDQILCCRYQNLKRICLLSRGLVHRLTSAVDQDEFPARNTVCIQYETDALESNLYKDPGVQSLLEKNISVHFAFLPYHDPFMLANCLCQVDE